MARDFRKQTLEFLHWFNSVWDGPNPVSLSKVLKIRLPEQTLIAEATRRLPYGLMP
jgi:hypothetical protein